MPRRSLSSTRSSRSTSAERVLRLRRRAPRCRSAVPASTAGSAFWGRRRPRLRCRNFAGVPAISFSTNTTRLLGASVATKRACRLHSACAGLRLLRGFPRRGSSGLDGRAALRALACRARSSASGPSGCARCFGVPAARVQVAGNCGGAHGAPALQARATSPPARPPWCSLTTPLRCRLALARRMRHRLSGSAAR